MTVTTRAQYRVLATARRKVFLGGVAEAQEKGVLAVHDEMGRTTAFRDVTGRLRRGIRSPVLTETRTSRGVRTTSTISVPYASDVDRRRQFAAGALALAPAILSRAMGAELVPLTRLMERM